MKKYARIDAGHVVEIVSLPDAINIADAFHPSFVFVPATADAAPGDAYTGGAFQRPQPVAPASIVPSSVSPAQARLALLGAGKLAQVEAIVAASDPATRIAWNNATVIERSSPTVAALSAALGLDAAQLDALFTAAAAIRV